MGFARVDFRWLHTRLVESLRMRVHNGEMSERALARLAHISQPHIHNVLKGTRVLSPEAADQLLDCMRIDLADLLMNDVEKAPFPQPCDECRLVPLLEGWIGPELPFPATVSSERYPFAAAETRRLRAPVAVRVSPDPRRAASLRAGGVALLDRDEEARMNPNEQGHFALDLAGAGTIGLVRRTRRVVSIWAAQSQSWETVRSLERDPLDIIRGRVMLLVQPL